jgi:hypothetical protein
MGLFSWLFGRKPAAPAVPSGPLRCDRCAAPVSQPVPGPAQVRVGVQTVARLQADPGAERDTPTAGPLDRIGLEAAYCVKCDALTCAGCTPAGGAPCPRCGGPLWRRGAGAVKPAVEEKPEPDQVTPPSGPVYCCPYCERISPINAAIAGMTVICLGCLNRLIMPAPQPDTLGPVRAEKADVPKPKEPAKSAEVPKAPEAGPPKKEEAA